MFGYAVTLGGEPALLERGSSRRIIVMRYPTREYQHDHRRNRYARPAAKGLMENLERKGLTGHSISADEFVRNSKMVVTIIVFTEI